MFDMVKWGGYLRNWRQDAQRDGGDGLSIVILLLAQAMDTSVIAEAELFQARRAIDKLMKGVGNGKA